MRGIILSMTIAWFGLSYAQLAVMPDYSAQGNWAALPERIDACDQLPAGYKDSDLSLPLKRPDVFYIYPTFYNRVPVTSWNAEITDPDVTKDVLELALAHQASVFCGISQLFVPFYRQMHVEGYRNAHLAEVRNAFDTAYADVLRAFEYYVQHYNQEASFVIAAHSQGTNHGERLIKERILPDSSLRKRLLLAYLIGMPVKEDFDDFPLCRESGQTHCFLTWRTYGQNYVPSIHSDSIAVIHPLTFSSLETINEPEKHLGVLMPKHRFRFPGSVVVRQMDGYLRVEQLNIPFAKRFQWQDYHRADYNLFWGNIRQNFVYRITKHEERVEQNAQGSNDN